MHSRKNLLMLFCLFLCVLISGCSNHSTDLKEVASDPTGSAVNSLKTGSIGKNTQISTLSDSPDKFIQVSTTSQNSELSKGGNSDETSVTPTAAHLDFYNEFNMYNSDWNYFKSFKLSEKWINGKPYYQLLNKKKNVKILVDQKQVNSVIYHNGKKMKYKMGYLLTGTSSYTTIDLLDITGDGKDELIICHSTGGTGAQEMTCDVINIDHMTKYKVDDYIYNLESRVKIQPLKMQGKNSVLCKITDTKGTIKYGTVSGFEEKAENYSYCPSKESSYHYYSVNYDKKCLDVGVGLTLEGCFLNYIGNIDSYMIYHPKTKSFKLSNNYKVKVYEPAKAPVSSNNKLQEKKLLEQIIKKDHSYSAYNVDIIADDFDGNGKEEYFYIFTKKDASKDDSLDCCADIWFGNEKGVSRKVKWQYILHDTYGSITLGGKKYFRYDLSYTTCSRTFLLRVALNKCSLYFNANGSINCKKNRNQFTVTNDCYDMTYMKSDDITCGHTWKNYYFYADHKGIHEYGAVKLSKKQFLSYKDAKKLLKTIQSKYSKSPDRSGKNKYKVSCHFLKRSNGLLHINIECENKDEILYYFRTYKIGKNNTLKLTYSDAGSYLTALNKKFAVYLSGDTIWK